MRQMPFCIKTLHIHVQDSKHISSKNNTMMTMASAATTTTTTTTTTTFGFIGLQYTDMVFLFVHLSVYRSNASMYCAKTILCQTFTLSGTVIILFFLAKTLLQNSNGNTLNNGIKYWSKNTLFCFFNGNHCLSRKRDKLGP